MVTATITIDAKQAQDARKHARKYVLELKKTGILPEIRHDFGKEWDPFIRENIENHLMDATRKIRQQAREKEQRLSEEEIAQRAAEKMTNLIDSLCAFNKNFKEMLYPPKNTVQGGDDEDEEDECEAPPLNFILPPVNLDNSFFASIRTQFLAFAKELSPESYEWFLEAAFWWTCSAIAMRRIAIDFSEPMYTNLYIALCAKSSVWKKSTALRPVKRILKGLSLSHLLHTGSETPEAFVQQASGNTIPRNFDELSDAEQDVINQELSTAGLEGLFIDELGQYLLGTRNANGPMGLWRRIILEWNECPEDWRKKTKGGGWEIVAKAYLPMCGCIVPDNLNEKDMEALQKDGSIARLLTITPPDETVAEVSSFELGYIQTPPELLKAFSQWHQRLKPPVANVIDENATDDKKGPKYAMQWIQPLEETTIRLTPEARQEWHNYRVAIRKCTKENELSSTFAAYYDRLGTDLIKMAAMAASFEGKWFIDLTHMALAFPFIEEARIGIHRLMRQAGYDQQTAKMDGADLDGIILQEIKKHIEKTGEYEFTMSVLLNRRKKLKKIGTIEVMQRIDGMVKAQIIKKIFPQPPETAIRYKFTNE